MHFRKVSARIGRNFSQALNILHVKGWFYIMFCSVVCEHWLHAYEPDWLIYSVNTIFQRYFGYIAAASAPIHAFLKFLEPVLHIILFPSHWLLSHINIVETTDSTYESEISQQMHSWNTNRSKGIRTRVGKILVYFILSGRMSRNIAENIFRSYTENTIENTDFHVLVASQPDGNMTSFTLHFSRLT